MVVDAVLRVWGAGLAPEDERAVRLVLAEEGVGNNTPGAGSRLEAVAGERMVGNDERGAGVLDAGA